LSQAINDGNPAHQLFNAAVGNLPAVDFVPRLDWSGMCQSDHFVQFYDSDPFLLDSLSGYVAAGLDAGEACVVITTPPHRKGLEERLRARGLDLAGARRGGRYVALDAEETLSVFMVDGDVDRLRFTEAVAPVIKGAAGRGRRVRAFGEMVALLWQEGRAEAALRLEGLWNGLRETQEFQLFCAYPMRCFGDGSQAGPLGRVCEEHSRAIPAESYTALADPEERLRAVIELQRKAARLEAEAAEREQALAREKAAREEAEAASRLKDEFLATVSHELRTPLTAIMGWTQILSSAGLDGPDAARALATIERNAKWQAQLVEDILDVSRIIRGKLRLDIVPVDLFAVVNAAADSLRPAADSKRISLEVSLDPSARNASGDACRLQQVVWNLISNAIKFTPEGGWVGVRVGRACACARITVSDTGCGIAAEFLPHVFDRFRQADGTTTRRHGGLGLGLSIVRHLVELHGGTVEAESDGEGRGATFRVNLPVAPRPTQPALS
jgi:signal transduction histidine kinase